MAGLTPAQAHFREQYLIPRGWKPPAQPGLLTRARRYLGGIIPARGLAADTGHLMPPQAVPLFCMASAGSGPGGGGIDYKQRIRTIIATSLRSATEGVLKEQVSTWYRETHGEEIPSQELDQALGYFERQKVIAISEEGKIVRYSQVKHIEAIAKRIETEVGETAALSQAVASIEALGRELFDGFKIYFDRGEIREAFDPAQCKSGEIDLGDKGTVYWLAFETTRPLYSPNHEPGYVEEILENKLQKAIGHVLGRVADKRGKSLKDLRAEEIPQAEKSREVVPSKIPQPGEEGYEEWKDRNELAMSGFYDRTTRVFAHICRLSRAYQLSVIEGIDCVFKDLKEKWPGQTVEVIDAGVGSAYFLERFMKRAQREGVSASALAIDLSKVACNIAKTVCRVFGNAVQVTKGNIARMTRFLEDADPVKPGSKKLVFLNYVLQYVPIKEVLMEANRVLEMGGRVLITNFKPKETMRWNEFWTNFNCAWASGRENKFGHGRLYEISRYLLLFLQRAVGIVRFAMQIDKDVREGIIPENPTLEELTALLKANGFRVLTAEDTHYHAGIRVYAEKVSELKPAS